MNDQTNLILAEMNNSMKKMAKSLDIIAAFFTIGLIGAVIGIVMVALGLFGTLM